MVIPRLSLRSNLGLELANAFGVRISLLNNPEFLCPFVPLCGKLCSVAILIPTHMYEKFNEVDGGHPWREVSPDGYVDYQARYRPQGRVVFFVLFVPFCGLPFFVAFRGASQRVVSGGRSISGPLRKTLSLPP